jgi:hypothetical protein
MLGGCREEQMFCCECQWWENQDMYDKENPMDIQRQAIGVRVFWVGQLCHPDWFAGLFERSDACDEVGEIRRRAKDTQDSACSFRLLEQYNWQDSKYECDYDHDRTTQLSLLEKRGAEQSKTSEGESRKYGETERHILRKVREDDDREYDTYS